MEHKIGSFGYKPTYEGVGIYKKDNLVNGDFPQVRRNIIVAGGQGLLKRGSVLGLVSKEQDASKGKYKLSRPLASAQKDGSEVPNCILAEDVDTSGEKGVSAVAYLSGEFNTRELYLGPPDGAHPLGSIVEPLRKINIYLSESVPLKA